MAIMNRAALIALVFAIISVSAGCGRKGPPIVPPPDNAAVSRSSSGFLFPPAP